MRITWLSVAVGTAAAAAVLVTLGRAAFTPPSVVAAAPAVAATVPPSVVAAAPAVAATVPPSPPAPVASPAERPATASAAVPAVRPAPFVQHFAGGPAASPAAPRKSPAGPVKVSAFVDGCDHNYGTPTQCVPLTFPGGLTDAATKCAWLTAHGFTSLVVAGRDDQRLDPDGDHVACR
ncbi:hypothetical protein ACWT_5985 [Actinoplanes sp. SE50]|uniref:hypothetical protein n=1 Tax=unclassified Actinoplanes TaxID=2626549 RepID=UPI0009C23AFD|nr:MULTISPECIES: hypothetical protein [unclassified Actinoplanes]ATO85400.1 hypothetical protein ACWT_5985 [Actinoplanes sp. SE50]SLM02812.1 hypothetical protein ACSP50_6097 [Actinoplanes sp. SE50/110]